ncbi:Fur family peroxide stress response transcriptional regulator [Fusobacterium naviforme]|nr:transcriptional repressor [Fusobacterium naviforme]PSL11290.1 Fur family peroxide stress response transcriptional regulator [Fusobacterium naviforme]STO28665.1 Peroxide-responsive repressor perR [Fusobacterium naviforme]
MEKTIKYSRQREAILKNLMSRGDHPTADALYQSLRREFPHISLGTVYRNLSLLSEMGSIRKVHCDDGTERYDYDTSDHCHFVCRSCGRVMDLPMKLKPDLNRMAEQAGLGDVDCHSLIFYGYCNDCRKAGRQNTDSN